MKKLIFILLILFVKFSDAQESADYYQRKDFSPLGVSYNNLLKAVTEANGISQVSFFDLNFVTIRLQVFCERYLNLATVGDPVDVKTKDNNTFTYKFIARVPYHGKPSYMYIKYYYFLNKLGNPIIKRCKIYGDQDDVVRFYVSYWPTNMHFSATRKNGVFYSYYWQDKIELTQNIFKNYGQIIIDNTQIKGPIEYEAFLQRSLAKTDTITKTSN